MKNLGKIIKCQINTRNFYARLESASLQIVSPTGRSIHLRKGCWGNHEHLGAILKDRPELHKSLLEKSIYSGLFPINLTIEEMIYLKDISKK